MTGRQLINSVQIFIFVVCNIVKLVIGFKLLEFSLDALLPYSNRLFYLSLFNGIQIICMAFTGFWAAGLCTSSKMNLFSKILLFTFMTSVLLLLCFYANLEDIPAIVHDYFSQKFNNMKNSPKNAGFVDSVQQTLGCCGVSGPADYEDMSIWSKYKNTLNGVKAAQNFGECSKHSITNNIGCGRELGHFIQKSIEKLATISILFDSLLIVTTQFVILTLGPEVDGYENEVLQKLAIPTDFTENDVAVGDIQENDTDDVDIIDAIIADADITDQNNNIIDAN